MMKFLIKDAVFIPLVSFLVFVLCYIWSERVIDYLKKKSLGSKDEIMKLLDLMFVEMDEKKLTTLMMLLSFGLGAIVFFALWPNILMGTILGSVLTILGWNLPLIAIKSVYDSRANKLVDQMVDGLTIMANGIKSGLSITQSMERVVENLPNPISQEFNLILSQIRLGRSVEEALADFGERVPKADVQMFVTAISILKETGGNLAETFQTIVQTIRERQKIEKKIQAMTAQGIMQGIIVSMVPIVLLVVFFVLDPKYVSPMFSTTLGLIMLLFMFALIFIGGLAIRKIVKINV